MNHEPTHLDLFSGIGGFTIAAGQAGFRTLAFCEIDGFCQRVLAKHWPYVLCIPDIKEMDGRIFRGVSLITGGFPCQPFSYAGKRRGTADDRALWPEMFRVIAEARPHWVLCENVVGIIDMELDQMLSDLEGIGYTTAPPLVFGAVAVDAPHRRQRVWVVAHSKRDLGHGAQRGEHEEAGGVEEPDRAQLGSSRQPRGTGAWERGRTGKGYAFIADDASQRLQGVRPAGEQKPEAHGGAPVSLRHGGDPAIWDAEPGMDRVVTRVSGRSHRLKALGNAIVPQCALPILKAIMEQIKR